MMRTKRVISLWMEVGFSSTSEVAIAIPPMTVRCPVKSTTPVAFPLVHSVPISPTFLLSRKFSSVISTVPPTSSDSPVIADLSNRRSSDACSRRMSAGTLLPVRMRTMSPAAMLLVRIVWKDPSRRTSASEGSMSRMAFMVFAVDQSWKAEKHACRMMTSMTRIARPRLYAAGLGSPRGLQQMKKMITPTQRMEQKPPKT